MISLEFVTLLLIMFFVAGCQKDVTFQVDTVTEVIVEPSPTHKGMSDDKTQEQAVTACYLRVYAVNHLDYGVKLAPQIKVNVHGIEHTLTINSWGDDWEYLVAGNKGEEYKQKLCFKESDENPLSCAELAVAIKNKAYKLELNRCEKIDQSPASCNMEIKLSEGGVTFRSSGDAGLDTVRLAD